MAGEEREKLITEDILLSEIKPVGKGGNKDRDKKEERSTEDET